MNIPQITRFAPSLTGPLHLGHAFAALVAEAHARASGGKFLLRIDDLDHTRCRPEFEAAIHDDLAWLGLRPDAAPRRQSEHFGGYALAFARLQDMGFVYPCFCTRADIQAEIQTIASAPQGPEGPLYPGTCRGIVLREAQARIAKSVPHSWRLDVARAASGLRLSFEELGTGPNGEHGTIEVRPEILGDVVLSRKEMPASYHLAVAMDDDAQGISLVTRGNDLFPATHLHRLLQHLLGLPTPRYAHHRLICDAAGKRLAKRDAALSLKTLRDAGVTIAEIHERLDWQAELAQITNRSSRGIP